MTTSRPTALLFFVIALSQYDSVVPCKKNHRQQGGADVSVVRGDHFLSGSCLDDDDDDDDFTNHNDKLEVQEAVR